MLIAECTSDDFARRLYLEGLGYQGVFEWLAKDGDAWYRRDGERRWGIYKRDGELAVFAGRFAATMNKASLDAERALAQDRSMSG